MQNFADYQPTEAVLEALQKVTLVTVVGASGAGKTALIKMACEQDPSLHVVISDASRPPRPGEQNGVDYFFRDKQDMLAAIERREYVQVAPSNTGDITASHIGKYASAGTAVIPIWADAVPVFRALPFKSLRTLYVVPVNYESWQKHLGLHGFTPEFRAKRLAEAERSLRFALEDKQLEFIINDDLQQATTDFLAAIHRAPDAPLPDPSRARAIVQDLLAQLKQELHDYNATS